MIEDIIALLPLQGAGGRKERENIKITLLPHSPFRGLGG